ncbi:MAG: hypothetical protein J6K46_00685 [Sutterella sp.]|nr:hypothetical protein [Sutterella sp.]
MILKTLLLLILIPLVFFIVTLGFFILQIWKMKKEGKVQSISITVAPKDDGETANFRLVDRVRLEGEIFDQAYRDETTLTVKPRPFELNLLSPEACAYLGVALAEIDVKMCENTRVLKGTRSQRISRVTSTADTLIEGETYMIVQRIAEPGVIFLENPSADADSLKREGIPAPLAEWMAENSERLLRFIDEWEATFEYNEDEVMSGLVKPETIYLLARRLLEADFDTGEACIRIRKTVESFGEDLLYTSPEDADEDEFDGRSRPVR